MEQGSYVNALIGKYGKIGIFEISPPFLFDQDTEEQVLYSVFDHMIVFHAAPNNRGNLQYLGCSPSFDKLEEGDGVPFYQCILHKNDNSRITLEWEKVKNKQII